MGPVQAGGPTPKLRGELQQRFRGAVAADAERARGGGGAAGRADGGGGGGARAAAVPVGAQRVGVQGRPPLELGQVALPGLVPEHQLQGGHLRRRRRGGARVLGLRAAVRGPPPADAARRADLGLQRRCWCDARRRSPRPPPRRPRRRPPRRQRRRSRRRRPPTGPPTPPSPRSPSSPSRRSRRRARRRRRPPRSSAARLPPSRSRRRRRAPTPAPDAAAAEAAPPRAPTPTPALPPAPPPAVRLVQPRTQSSSATPIASDGAVASLLVAPGRGETRIDGRLYLQSRTQLAVGCTVAPSLAGTRLRLLLLDADGRPLLPQWRVLEPADADAVVGETGAVRFPPVRITTTPYKECVPHLRLAAVHDSVDVNDVQRASRSRSRSTSSESSRGRSTRPPARRAAGTPRAGNGTAPPRPTRRSV